MFTPPVFFSVHWCVTQASHTKSGLSCSVRQRSQRRRKGWGPTSSEENQQVCRLDEDSDAPFSEFIPELNPCIAVATMMSASVITEAACVHTHTISPRQVVHCSEKPTSS